MAQAREARCSQHGHLEHWPSELLRPRQHVGAEETASPAHLHCRDAGVHRTVRWREPVQPSRWSVGLGFAAGARRSQMKEKRSQENVTAVKSRPRGTFPSVGTPPVLGACQEQPGLAVTRASLSAAPRGPVLGQRRHQLNLRPRVLPSFWSPAAQLLPGSLGARRQSPEDAAWRGLRWDSEMQSRDPRRPVPPAPTSPKLRPGSEPDGGCHHVLMPSTAGGRCSAG